MNVRDCPEKGLMTQERRRHRMSKQQTGKWWANAEWDILGRGLMTVLLEKTTGEARLSAKAVNNDAKRKGT